MKTVRLLFAAVVVFGTLAFATSSPASVPDRADPFATAYARLTAEAGEDGDAAPSQSAARTPTPRPRPTADDAPEGLPSGAYPVEVVGHVDGDKIRVEASGEEREVLLIGVDAPETDEGPLGECYAAGAAERLEELAPEGETIYLLAGAGDEEDNRDRLLRFAWADDDGEALFVNGAMLEDGFASFQTREGSDHFDEDLQDAERAARDDDAGLWGECGGNHVEIVPPTPTPQLGDDDLPAPIGTQLREDDISVTLTNAFYAYEYGFSTPKGGYVYLVVEATIENVGDEEQQYAGNQFSARDLDTDAQFDDTFTLNDGGLGSGELSPGEYVSGVVVLEVQETVRRVRVKYDPQLFEDGDLYWVVER